MMDHLESCCVTGFFADLSFSADQHPFLKALRKDHVILQYSAVNAPRARSYLDAISSPRVKMSLTDTSHLLGWSASFSRLLLNAFIADVVIEPDRRRNEVKRYRSASKCGCQSKLTKHQAEQKRKAKTWTAVGLSQLGSLQQSIEGVAILAVEIDWIQQKAEWQEDNALGDSEVEDT